MTYKLIKGKYKDVFLTENGAGLCESGVEKLTGQTITPSGVYSCSVDTRIKNPKKKGWIKVQQKSGERILVGKTTFGLYWFMSRLVHQEFGNKPFWIKMTVEKVK